MLSDLHQPGFAFPAAASIIAKIWSSRKLFTWKAFAGQIPAQIPQPMHLTSLCEIIPSLSMYGEPNGQTRRQLRQDMHSARLCLAMIPETASRSCESTTPARPAAASACPIVSSRFFGACPRPQTKSPSLGKSTGRSFTCASR